MLNCVIGECSFQHIFWTEVSIFKECFQFITFWYWICSHYMLFLGQMSFNITATTVRNINITSTNFAIYNVLRRTFYFHKWILFLQIQIKITFSSRRWHVETKLTSFATLHKPEINKIQWSNFYLARTGMNKNVT